MASIFTLPETITQDWIIVREQGFAYKDDIEVTVVNNKYDHVLEENNGSITLALSTDPAPSTVKKIWDAEKNLIGESTGTTDLVISGICGNKYYPLISDGVTCDYPTGEELLLNKGTFSVAGISELWLNNFSSESGRPFLRYSNENRNLITSMISDNFYKITGFARDESELSSELEFDNNQRSYNQKLTLRFSSFDDATYSYFINLFITEKNNKFIVKDNNGIYWFVGFEYPMLVETFTINGEGATIEFITKENYPIKQILPSSFDEISSFNINCDFNDHRISRVWFGEVTSGDIIYYDKKYGAHCEITSDNINWKEYVVNEQAEYNINRVKDTGRFDTNVTLTFQHIGDANTDDVRRPENYVNNLVDNNHYCVVETNDGRQYFFGYDQYLTENRGMEIQEFKKNTGVRRGDNGYTLNFAHNSFAFFTMSDGNKIT